LYARGRVGKKSRKCSGRKGQRKTRKTPMGYRGDVLLGKRKTHFEESEEHFFPLDVGRFLIDIGGGRENKRQRLGEDKTDTNEIAL